MIKTIFVRFIYVYLSVFLCLSNVNAAGLSPESFNILYSYASDGNIDVLRNATARGMNIDTMNSNGMTGLCVAISKNNYMAYNTLRLSGANPKHPCIQQIPPQQYSNFMSSSNLHSSFRVTTPGVYEDNNMYKVLGWGLLIGGGVALAFGLSGGGGGGSSKNKDQTPIVPEPCPFKAYNGEQKTNNGLVEISEGCAMCAVGTNSDGTLASTILNDVDGLIRTKNNNLYAMYATNGGIAQNRGKIEVQGKNSYGIFTSFAGNAINSGEIVVSGMNSYGVFIESERNNQYFNNIGTISVLGENSYAIGGATPKGGSSNYGKYGISNQGRINVTGNNSIGMAPTSNGNGLYRNINNSSGEIFIDGTNSIGIQLNKASGYNLGLISISGEKAIGANVSDGNIFENDGTMNVSGAGAYAIKANLPNYQTIKNTGTITMSDASNASYGIYAEGNGILDKNKNGIINNGVINVRGEASYGIYALNGITARSLDGTTPDTAAINVSGNASVGAFVKNASAIYASKINVSGNGSYGAQAQGQESYANVTTTNVDGIGSYGLYAKDKGLIAGEVFVNGNGSYGAYLDTNGLSDALKINVVGQNSTGVYIGEGAKANVSKLEINNAAANSNAIQINGGTLVFSPDTPNTFNIGASGATGIYVSKGTYDNNKNFNLSNGAYALRSDGASSIITNYSNITASNNSVGMHALNGSKSSNEGVISANGDSSVAMLSESGSIATNNSIITVSGSQAIGMVADGGTINNNSAGASINATGNQATGAYIYNGGTGNLKSITTAGIQSTGVMVDGEGSNATADIILNGNGSRGIYADNSATVSGNVTINQTNSVGVYLDNKSVGNSLKVNIKNSNNIGVYAGKDSVANIDSITLNNSLSGNTLIHVNGGTVNFTGVTNSLSINGNGSNGVVVEKGSFTNKNGFSISVSGSNSSAMAAMGSESSITNNGTITVGNLSKGMASTSGATMTNNGTISISGSNAYGMYGSQSNIINEGTINITGSGSYGIYAINSSKITNNGTILLNGASKPSDCTPPYDNAKCGRYIFVDSTSTFSTNGDVIIDGIFDFSSLGNGKIELDVGGSYTADSLSGKVYASSGIVMGGNKDSYSSKNAFRGENDGIDLQSSSYMFNAELKENKDGKYDIVMNRKSFDKLNSDSSIASFLENNYQAGNNATMFDNLKLSSDATGFNQAVSQDLGLNLFPNFAKQNLDVVKSLNNQMTLALINNEDDSQIRGSSGVDFYYRNQNSDNGISGYDDKATSIFASVDKSYNSNLRYGMGASLTQYYSDYSDDNSRKETIIQIYAPLLYQKDNHNIVSTPRFGAGFGDYKRHTSQGQYSAYTLNYYYGITNYYQHNLDMGIFTLQPVAEFNILGVYQDQTKENGHLRVSSSNNLSIEGGLGLYGKKVWNFDKDSFSLRAGGTYYHEFNDSYTSSQGSFADMIGSYHIRSREIDRNRVVLSARGEYKLNDLTFYGELKQYLEESNAQSADLGLNWNF